MSSIRNVALVAAITGISACGGGSGGGSGSRDAPPQIPSSQTISSRAGEALARSRVQVTRFDEQNLQLRFTDGPLEGVVAICAEGGARECRVTGATMDGYGRIENILSGEHAIAGTLALRHADSPEGAFSHHRLHLKAPDSAAGRVVLPTQGVTQFTGRFAGGGSLHGTAGQVSGDVNMLADFDTGLIGGNMLGAITQNDGAVQSVAATFSNLTIDRRTGEFAGSGTNFSYGSTLAGAANAGGAMSGSFYGASAQEAAGVFEMGNEAGGMSGAFVACRGNNAGCIRTP
jgi:hypothetical protein